MRAKRAELEAQGRRLAFVGAVGDNFYWDGLQNASEAGAEQWSRWLWVYDGLRDVPWLAAFGNHDLGNGDRYATCPERRPLASVNGHRPTRATSSTPTRAATGRPARRTSARPTSTTA